MGPGTSEEVAAEGRRTVLPVVGGRWGEKERRWRRGEGKPWDWEERESGVEREEEEEDEKVGVVVGDIHDVLGEATESGVRWVGGGRLTCAGGTTTRR